MESKITYIIYEEQWTYVISVEDTDTGKGVAFSAIGVCPLGEDKVDPLSDDVAHPIYRTKRELQFKGLFPDFNAHFEKYGSFYDAGMICTRSDILGIAKPETLAAWQKEYPEASQNIESIWNDHH